MTVAVLPSVGIESRGEMVPAGATRKPRRRIYSTCIQQQTTDEKEMRSGVEHAWHAGIVSHVPLGSCRRLVQEPHWILAAKSSKKHKVCPAQQEVVMWGFSGVYNRVVLSAPEATWREGRG